MSNFVASNGIGVEINNDTGRIVFADTIRPSAPLWMGEGEIDALREYFQAEEDKRLGRWRWPENPDYVVYLVGEELVDVLREGTVSEITRGPGREQGISRQKAVEWDRDYSQNFYGAARAYFDAHPEPKPWHDAKPGEVWLITTRNVSDERAVQVHGDQFHYNDGVEFPLTYDAIESGRRIWPVRDAS